LWPLFCIEQSSDTNMFKEATMIRSLYAAPAMFCLAAAIVTAQAPAPDRPNPPAAEQPAAQQPTTPRPATPPASSTAAANKVTYTGCIKPGTATDTWILENAEVAAKAGSAPATVGTSGTAKMSFSLSPAATVNLKPHANHKVEVVGTVSPATAGAAAAAPSPAAAAQAPTQQISVESLKMVSATCP
jgi:hypothetical protein